MKVIALRALLNIRTNKKAAKGEVIEATQEEVKRYNYNKKSPLVKIKAGTKSSKPKNKKAKPKNKGAK